MANTNNEIEKVILGIGAAVAFASFVAPALLIVAVHHDCQRYLERSLREQVRLGLCTAILGSIFGLIARYWNVLPTSTIAPIANIGRLSITYPHVFSWAAINALAFGALYLTAPLWAKITRRFSKYDSDHSTEFRL